MTEAIRIADVGDVPAGTCVPAEIDGHRLAVFNLDGTYYVIDDMCPHSGASLSEGDWDGRVVRCPWHGSEFDITTGEALSPPASHGVNSYKVRVEGQEIQIELE
jgi:nitrite reductase/ring-hydroxylating ferredoxin subunit